MSKMLFTSPSTVFNNFSDLPAILMNDSWFQPLAILGHTFTNWVILVSVIFFITFLLFRFKKISKKTFIVIFISLMCFLTAVSIHLILDALIMEKSYWI